MKQLFFVSLAFCISFSAAAFQSIGKSDKITSHKDFKKGERLFNNGNYVAAEEQFQILLDSGFRDNELLTYQAQVHLELHEPHAAKEVILMSEQRNQDLDFLLAVSNYYLEEFDDALYELSLITDTASYHVDDMYDRIFNAMAHYKDKKGYVVQNFGPEVNTEFQEYAAIMLNGFEDLLFTTRNDTSEYAAHDGMAFEEIHETSIDSLNKWHVSNPFEFHTSHEKRHDATVQAYQGGKKLITYHDGQLFKSHLVDSVWEEDGVLDIHNVEDGMDTHCWIADDESFVIFASDYHNYGHNLDLFVSYQDTTGKWSEPEPINELNTEHDEDSPFLAEDSTLYFSSRGHGSLGGYDVFKSTYVKRARRWSRPVNLDYPISTVAEDIYFTIHGHVGYVSSTRNGGYGSFDLYRVLFFNKILITGKLLDQDTGEPIPEAMIELEYDSLYFRSYTDKEGNYEMFVPVNEDMKITFVKDDKVMHSQGYYVDAFFRDQENRNHNFEIPVDGQAVAVTHASASGAGFIHLDVQNMEAESPFIASIDHDKVEHWSDSLNNTYEQRHIAIMTPEPGMVSVFFDFDKHDMGISGEEELKELYNDILKDFEFKVLVEGHTDSRGSDKYNIKLSQRRATTVAKYLLSLGLERSRLEVDAHGESKLLHHDDSEESHAKNRRVEIKFY